MIPSRGVKVAGILGPAAPMEKKSAAVADVHVGIGGTTQWKLAGLVRAEPFVAHGLVCACHKCLPSCTTVEARRPGARRALMLLPVFLFVPAKNAHPRAQW